MRGEFLGVWSDTWREIWSELITHEAAPDDLFCELYRELASMLQPPGEEQAFALVMCDEILTKSAFDQILLMDGVPLNDQQRRCLFDEALKDPSIEPTLRKERLQEALASQLGDRTSAKTALDTAIANIVTDPIKVGEAWERVVEVRINDSAQSQIAFERTQPEDFDSERTLVLFFEKAFEIIEEYGGEELSNRYFNLLEGFIKKFSLRYDLRRPCTICPTLPGVFANLINHLRKLTMQDANLNTLMRDFDNSIRDLRIDCSDMRIKTCMNKQFMLLEALGSSCPGVTAGTLGDMCGQINNWPHPAIKESLKKLYGFGSNYPGIRHGTNGSGVIREIDMRDMVAMSILLAGFTPYLTENFDANAVYQG